MTVIDFILSFCGGDTAIPYTVEAIADHKFYT